MNILITGSAGMCGTALCNNLKNIRDGKNKTRPNIHIDEIYEYDLNSTPEELDSYCRKADFVFNLAGVNRPENPEDFMKGNFGFASTLLDTLKKYNNKATIMLSSSIQATLAGRFGNSEYGRSKKAGEELFFDYAKETGAKVAVYRFPNLMGHSRPKYNSAVSTFCNRSIFTRTLKIWAPPQGCRFTSPYNNPESLPPRAGTAAAVPQQAVLPV